MSDCSNYFTQIHFRAYLKDAKLSKKSSLKNPLSTVDAIEYVVMRLGTGILQKFSAPVTSLITFCRIEMEEMV